MNPQRAAEMSAFVLLAFSSAGGCLGDCGEAPDGGPPVVNSSDDYNGPTPGSIIPEFPDTDGGEFVYDSGPLPEVPCCLATYWIEDNEAETATGVLHGEHAAFGEGVPLERGGGYWSAEVCIPLEISYAYRFVFLTTFEEEVERFYDDGGTGTETVEVVVENQRASPSAPVYYDDNNRPYNVQEAIASCDELPVFDAGPPVTDAGHADAGTVDAGGIDAGGIDAGDSDAGPPDAGPSDAGPGSGSCGYNQYSCNFGLGACISNTRICDGVDDCQTGVPDDEDPYLCGSCNVAEYDCGGGSCVASSSWCDGTTDCPNFFDESVCCNAPEIWCAANRTCLGTSAQCDGTEDCSSGHDESAYVCGGCAPGEFACGNDFGRCIPASQLCDGIDQCESGYADDESPVMCGGGSCSVNEFTCEGASCLSNTAYCDGTADCANLFDEPLWCGGGGGGPGCEPTDFVCDDGACLPSFVVCDGFPDCLGGEDEFGC